MFVSFVALIGGGGLAGCAATNSGRIQARINEKPDAFAKLTKQEQKDIKWGYVRKGYTPEMVYFAFGKPDQILTSADKDAYVWVFVDRTANNEEIAKASAMRSASQGDSIMVRNGAAGSRTTVWPGHDANFPSLVSKDQTFPVSDQSSADIYSSINATEDLPTIWVAFRDNAVINVQRFGDKHQKEDKTGSLGG